MSDPSTAQTPRTRPVRGQNRRVAVFGAYGHTAGFVVAELRQRGWTPILCGRDAAKLQIACAHTGADIRVASIDDPASLDRALDSAAGVINCAGPFAETGPAVIDAALRAGIHYLDTCGEAIVTLSTFDQYAHNAATGDVVVLPAAGFFGALGDLLVTATMGDWISVDEVFLAVALDGWKPTPGTRLAGQRRAGRRVVFTANRIEIRAAGEQQPASIWNFPEPFGKQDVLGEFPTVDVVTISRHVATPEIRAYINLAPIADLRDPNCGPPEPADESGCSSQKFLLEAVARRGKNERRASVSGRDIYAVTAPIIVEAFERIMDGRHTRSGVVAAGELFDAASFLRALSPAHLTLAEQWSVV